MKSQQQLLQHYSITFYVAFRMSLKARGSELRLFVDDRPAAEMVGPMRDKRKAFSGGGGGVTVTAVCPDGN